MLMKTLASRKPLKPACNDSSNAARDMHRRAFFTNGQPRGNNQRLFLFYIIVYQNGKETHKRKAFDEEGRITEEPLHDEARENALNFRDTRPSSIFCQAADK